MKKWWYLTLVFVLVACTNKKASIPPNNTTQQPSGNSNQNTSLVSYSATVMPLMQNNCNNCHSTPGSGGINLDNYTSIKQIALSGQLIPDVTNTDTMSIIMPPPPQRHLDTTEINALNQWIIQGCLNN